MDSRRIGVAIKTLRLRAGYTQNEVAACLNVTDKAVSKWERGLSVPDVSIVTKLSILLNCDVDNLLEGNITYLEQSWQGLLILPENGDVYAGSDVYGKPLVYLFLSYFLLAGISDVCIVCPKRDRAFMEEQLGNGCAWGIRLSFRSSLKDCRFPDRNIMVAFHNPFLYGVNLTKYFQRAMSRQNGISVLTVDKSRQEKGMVVSFDKHKAVLLKTAQGEAKQYCVPIVFMPMRYADLLPHVESVEMLQPLFAEPMGNGMIEYSVTDRESLLDTAQFLRFLHGRMGKDVYDLREIAARRGFITL